MLSMLPLRLAVVPSFLQLLQKFVQSPQSPTSIRKFLNKFFCSITFNKVHVFHQNSIFVAETFVYIELLIPNRRLLSSNAHSISE